MSKYISIVLFLGILLVFLPEEPAWSTDMRKISQKVASEYQKALKESKEQKKNIRMSRKELKKAIAKARQSVSDLKSEIKGLQNEYTKLEDRKQKMSVNVDQIAQDLKGYAGVVRQTAKDVHSVLSGSHFNAREPNRIKVLEFIKEPKNFPGISKVEGLAELIFDEIKKTGEVKTLQGSFLDRDGRMREGTLLTLGPFTAAYLTQEETGFLRYSKAHQSFAALAELPGFSMRKDLKSYIKGKSRDVYIDPSRGSALKRIAHRSTFTDKIKKGGILVWPILGIGFLALIIVLERIVFLQRVHANADRVMGQFNKLAANGDWKGCRKLLEPKKKRLHIPRKMASQYTR